MTYRNLPDFAPVPAARGLFVTRRGLANADGVSIRIASWADIKRVMPLLQGRMATAVAMLLPAMASDGAEPWEAVSASALVFSVSPDPVAVEKAAEDLFRYLSAANAVACNAAGDDDILVLRAFCDNHLPALMRDLPARSPTVSREDIDGILDGDDSGYVTAPAVRILPSLQSCGAELPPFETVRSLPDYFMSWPDIEVLADRIVATRGLVGFEVEVVASVAALLRAKLGDMSANGHSEAAMEIADEEGTIRLRVFRPVAGNGTFRRLPNSPPPAIMV